MSTNYKMTSLAEQFLDDIDSSDDESQQVQPTKKSEPIESHPAPDFDAALAGTLRELEARIAQTPENVVNASSSSSTPSSPSKLSTDTDAEYSLVSDCAAAIAQVDEAILTLHRSLISAYSPAFPELETLILNPMDYARVARLASSHSSLSSVDFRPILPSASVITVQVTASSSAGRQLSDSERGRVCDIADLMLCVDKQRAGLLTYMISRANVAAPNLVAVVGGAVAAKLIAFAGGLTPLAQMPSGNVKVLGKTRHVLQGASSRSTRLHDGVVHSCALVIAMPPHQRSRAGDMVCGKACLAARVDACRAQPDGQMGQRLRTVLEGKLHKMQERAPARTAKPLPVPGDEVRRRHRGGARSRKEKERMGLTDARRMANRLKFGEAEVVKGNDLEHEGLGMFGAADSQRLKIGVKKTDTVSVAAKRKLAKLKKKDGRSAAERAGIDSAGDVGMEDCLVLAAPEAKRRTAGESEGKKKANYFTASTPFLGVDKGKRDIGK